MRSILEAGSEQLHNLLKNRQLNLSQAACFDFHRPYEASALIAFSGLSSGQTCQGTGSCNQRKLFPPYYTTISSCCQRRKRPGSSFSWQPSGLRKNITNTFVFRLLDLFVFFESVSLSVFCYLNQLLSLR